MNPLGDSFLASWRCIAAFLMAIVLAACLSALVIVDAPPCFLRRILSVFATSSASFPCLFKLHCSGRDIRQRLSRQWYKGNAEVGSRWQITMKIAPDLPQNDWGHWGNNAWLWLRATSLCCSCSSPSCRGFWWKGSEIELRAISI
jgi:hypothetical protein